MDSVASRLTRIRLDGQIGRPIESGCASELIRSRIFRRKLNCALVGLAESCAKIAKFFKVYGGCRTGRVSASPTNSRPLVLPDSESYFERLPIHLSAAKGFRKVRLGFF